MKRWLTIGAALLVLCVCVFASGTAHAVVGQAITTITVPVPSPTGIGVSIAADCEGNLYYTNFESPFLHRMTKTGALISTVSLLDATGAPVTIGEIAWDDRRKVLWGGTDDQTPIKIYQINPVTGLCTFQFNGAVGVALTDGLAFEQSTDGNPANDLIYHSPDVSTDVTVFQATTGALVRVITPKDAGGNPIGLVSGLTVGTGNTLYIGNNGNGQIIRVNKLNGDFIGSFASPGGRDEGLECDAINFYPRLALWSKDAFNNTVTAIEVEVGTCACGGVVPAMPTSWGHVKGTYR